MTTRREQLEIDEALFPLSFLRLLSLVPAAVRRMHAGVADGRRAMRGEGGRYLFRGHREYRPGDDLRRVDWNVEARHDRLVVRQFDAEKDVLTEVWFDASASMAPFGGRRAMVQAAALACATGLGEGGRIRLGCFHQGEVQGLLQASEPGQMRQVLHWLSVHAPSGRADLASALPRLVRRVPRGARFVLVSDLLSRADPGVLHTLAGRNVRGAILHLRVPQVTAPAPQRAYLARDVETGEERRIRVDAACAARIAARAKAHADLWAHHAHLVGLVYLPFGPAMTAEALLRRIILEVP
ncbi:MAG: DUF58 domain-containing protein [Planctomycetota bacterium]|nr:DUF58 domain-containing protein [Planctomycetota bacterium]